MLKRRLLDGVPESWAVGGHDPRPHQRLIALIDFEEARVELTNRVADD